MFNQVILDWWERENELRHRVHKAEPDTSLDFRDIKHTGEAFCVWELVAVGFERNVWVQTILAQSERPDLEAYVRQGLGYS